MQKAEYENKLRNREIAENEATRSAFSQVRVSAWAVLAVCLFVLASLFYVFAH